MKNVVIGIKLLIIIFLVVSVFPFFFAKIFSNPENEVWRTNLHQRISNTPVVDGDFIYVQTKGKILKLDALGNIIWSTEISSNRDFVSPQISEDLIIAADRKGALYALDKIDGTIKWRHAETSFQGETVEMIGDIVIENDLVFISYYSNRILSLELETGQEQWEILFSGRSAPDIAVSSDYLIYDIYYDHLLSFVDVDSGDLVFQKKYNEKYMIRDLVVEGDFLYILFIEDSNHWRITRLNLEKGSFDSGYDLNKFYFTCMAIDDQNVLLSFREGSYKIDFEAGEIVWKNEFGLGACPVLINDHLILNKNLYGRGVIIDQDTGIQVEKLPYPGSILGYFLSDINSAVRFQDYILFPMYSDLVLLDLNE